MPERKHELVGNCEIATMFGVQHNTVQAWQQRKWTNFPQPAINLSYTPLWEIADIITWAGQTGRKVLTATPW